MASSDTSNKCGCGRPAVEMSRGSKRCAVCKEIEERNEHWLTNYHPNCDPHRPTLQNERWWTGTRLMINRGYAGFAERNGIKPMPFTS